MTIPAATVTSVCTRPEAALVRASRKGELERLNPAQLQQMIVRARKLSGKWQGLGRGQSRARSRKVGFGDADANTELKAQIFREALESFQARLAELDGIKGPPAKKSKPKTKRDRSTDHRASRAAVRKGMTAVEDLLNTPDQRKERRAVKAASAPAAEPKKSAAPSPPKKGAPKLRPPVAAITPKKGRVKDVHVVASRQLKVGAAAKQSKIARSGKTTRTFGHIAARGKRSQARRDAKN